jgi:hypothetical protein
MTRDLIDALMRPWALCAGAVALALAVVMPLLVGPTTDGAGLALVALVVGALLACGRRGPVLIRRRLTLCRAPGSSDPCIRLHGDVTDPRHHPLRPRAPGMA